MKFSENLIKLRKQEGMSQEDLGEKLNVARQTISKWENSETTPELDKLLELAKIFQISVDELIGNDILPKYKKYKQNYYEFISKTKIGNLPLVHINIGYGLRNIKEAKGIFAIGNIAKGVFAFGGMAIGLFAFGGIALGLISLGALALALLLSIGGISIGSLAIGGIALGIFAIGGFALGIYSIGGCAIALKIAYGGYANAHIAIGDYTDGTIEFLTSTITPATSSEIKNAILQEFPKTWKIIVTIFSKAIF